MTLDLIFPPELTAWFLHYGISLAAGVFLLFILAVLFRPFFLWLSGRSELLDRMKRLEETQRKALLELEILNQTLSIPLKRAASSPRPAPPEEPMVVTQQTKDSFLKALRRSPSAE